MPPETIKTQKLEKTEKSQPELRAILEQKLVSLKPILDEGIKEYEQALKDDVFDDALGEEAGAGEKRKEALQKKLTTLIDRAEKMRQTLDSGEDLPQEPLLDPEALKTEFTPFLQETWKLWNIDADKIKKAKISPEIKRPTDEDYQARQTDIDTTKFGEFTLNPDTQNLDWETLQDKIFIPDLSSFVGKPLSEVAQYLITTYGSTHKLPGLEYWKFMLENPNKVPSDPNGVNLKDGNDYFNFGSLVRNSDGHWRVPYADWNGSDWYCSANWLDNSWDAVFRIVLLEI